MSHSKAWISYATYGFILLNLNFWSQKWIIHFPSMISSKFGKSTSGSLERFSTKQHVFLRTKIHYIQKCNFACILKPDWLFNRKPTWVWIVTFLYLLPKKSWPGIQPKCKIFILAGSCWIYGRKYTCGFTLSISIRRNDLNFDFRFVF